MKRTPLTRKTALRQCSPKLAAAMSTEIRRAGGAATVKPLRPVAIKASTKRMRQGRSTGKPTAAQQARFNHINMIGCVACRTIGYDVFNPEVHHLNEGGYHGAKRRGHDFTIGLCPWHHQGRHPITMSADRAREVFGPSYKLHKKAFRERFGTDDQLLETQNKLIALRELAVANG